MLKKLADAERHAAAGGFPDLAQLHKTHIEALDGTPPTSSPGHASTSAVRRRERALQADLVEAAMAAESGALARLLASMSAAVSQQLVTFPRSAG